MPRPETEEVTLVDRYRPLALGLARDYFIVGADRDDVRQEAMYALVLGLRAYDPARGDRETFLRLVIRRWLWTSIRGATRAKHRPLNESLRVIESPEDGEIDAVDAMACPASDVVEILEDRRRLRALVDALVEDASEMERSAALALARGLTYRETAETLGTSEKAVDNARARLRGKFERRLAA